MTGRHDDTQVDAPAQEAAEDLLRVVADLRRTVARLEAQVDERTADLQRVKAEFDNYRKRVRRDEWAVRHQAVANVLKEMLPVLDEIGRARARAEPNGLQGVSESFERAVGRLGLETFGQAGDRFDPAVHEPLTSSSSATVTEPTVARILQPGYRAVGRILRPAWVEIVLPDEDARGEGERR